ncbi:MAG: hypothetical protein LJE69_07765 [Thiohalocapsa sp.]|jgi:hypothetical protein|uniref:hypothetical protein n=1 Tax=Thiohalocapsa sp. TaxID=2497641 RepID=UPI0025ED3B37|nr:hypothetical protein [Thiohalocapsa sp.]MCG6941131.1 hypothetical protein [Thiohalocapsa sp.]
MEPTQSLNWIKGFRAALQKIGARQSDQYSWMGITEDAYVFTAEIDHREKEHNKYDHKGGMFEKWVKPLSLNDGVSPKTIKHSQELLGAVKRAYGENLKCRLLLLKGTKYGTTPGGVRAAVDPDPWVVTEFSGTVIDGFGFTLQRTT